MLHLHWFTEHRSDTLVSLARVASGIGSPVVLGATACAAAVWLWMRGLRLGLAVAPGFALMIAAVTAAAAKTLVGRSRPPVPLHLVSETNASFPSGHATDAAALFVTLSLVVAVFVLRRPLARLACVATSLAAAGCVGISRLILGVHWPTDVLAGWSIGLGIALAVTITASLIAHVTRGRQSLEGAVLGRAVRIFDARRDGVRRRRLQAA